MGLRSTWELDPRGHLLGYDEAHGNRVTLAPPLHLHLSPVPLGEALLP